MEKIELFDSLPENWTYPEIQPKLIAKVNNFIGDENIYRLRTYAVKML